MRITDQNIHHVYIDQNERSSSFTMSTHHFHPYCELYYLHHGTCRFFIDHTIYTIHGGDLVIIPQHVLHYTKYVGTCLRSAIFFQFEDVEAIQEYASFLQEPSLHIFHISSSLKQSFETKIEEMLSEERFLDAQASCSLRLQLQSLLLMVQRYGTPIHGMMESLHTTDQQVIQAAQYISKHYHEPITTQIIAHKVGLTPNYLSTKFHELTGTRLHEYLVIIRLHHAERMLLSTNRSLTDIALSCGFTDSNYFSDAFKKMYGLSPRYYKKKTDPSSQ